MTTSKKERNAIVTKIESEGAKPRELNRHQQDHIDGKIDVYKPIEAYVEEWVHVADEEGNFIAAYPKEGTRKRQDLPSLAEQWRRSFAERKR